MANTNKITSINETSDDQEKTSAGLLELSERFDEQNSKLYSELNDFFCTPEVALVQRQEKLLTNCTDYIPVSIESAKKTWDELTKMNPIAAQAWKVYSNSFNLKDLGTGPYVPDVDILNPENGSRKIRPHTNPATSGNYNPKSRSISLAAEYKQILTDSAHEFFSSLNNFVYQSPLKITNQPSGYALIHELAHDSNNLESIDPHKQEIYTLSSYTLIRETLSDLAAQEFGFFSNPKNHSLTKTTGKRVLDAHKYGVNEYNYSVNKMEQMEFALRLMTALDVPSFETPKLLLTEIERLFLEQVKSGQYAGTRESWFSKPQNILDAINNICSNAIRSKFDVDSVDLRDPAVMFNGMKLIESWSQNKSLMSMTALKRGVISDLVKEFDFNNPIYLGEDKGNHLFGLKLDPVTFSEIMIETEPIEPNGSNSIMVINQIHEIISHPNKKFILRYSWGSKNPDEYKLEGMTLKEAQDVTIQRLTADPKFPFKDENLIIDERY